MFDGEDSHRGSSGSSSLQAVALSPTPSSQPSPSQSQLQTSPARPVVLRYSSDTGSTSVTQDTQSQRASAVYANISIQPGSRDSRGLDVLPVGWPQC